MRPLASRDLLGMPLRRAHVLLGGAAVVLIYHRVADRAYDPQVQCVPVARFEAQMRLLAEEFTPMSLETLVAHLERRERLPERAVAVTFDDGYADNFANAYPVLQRYGVPGTVFVNSYLVDEPRAGWVDELERLMLRARLPRRLDVAGGDARLVFEFDAESATSPSDPRWDVSQPPPAAREAAYLELAACLRAAGPAERDRVLEQVREQVEAPAPDIEADRIMSASEVRTLATEGLVAIGSHTRHHRLLAAADVAEQRAELVDDRRALEAVTGRPVTLFSYPYGGRTDYSDETVRLVQETGFVAACANHVGVTSPWTDRMRIPRISPIRLETDALREALRAWPSSGR